MKACDVFVYTDQLFPIGADKVIEGNRIIEEIQKQKDDRRQRTILNKVGRRAQSEMEIERKRKLLQKRLNVDIEICNQVYQKCSKNNDGILIDTFTNNLKKAHPSFQYAPYGVKKFKEFIEVQRTCY